MDDAQYKRRPYFFIDTDEIRPSDLHP
jgi:hypothetical protein